MNKRYFITKKIRLAEKQAPKIDEAIGEALSEIHLQITKQDLQYAAFPTLVSTSTVTIYDQSYITVIAEP